jgi:plastocyanin domain-containing protein
MKKIIIAALALTLSFNILAAQEQIYKLTVTEKGFEPSELKVKPDVPVVLKITRKTNGTCAREIIVPAKNIKVDLPMDKEVTVNVGKLQKGEIKFGCSMEMMVGGVMFVN